MKCFVICTSLFSLLLLTGACGRKQIRVTTKTLEMDIRIAYEACLLEEGGDFEFNSQKEFIAKLEGNNPRGLRYLGLTRDMLDKDAQVIDEWGRPLQIKRPEKARLEIRSAGPDGRFGTQDDIVEVHPRVKNG